MKCNKKFWCSFGFHLKSTKRGCPELSHVDTRFDRVASTFESPVPSPRTPGEPRGSHSLKLSKRKLKTQQGRGKWNPLGSKSRVLVNIPIPTRIDKNGWCTYPKMVPLVLTHSHFCDTTERASQRLTPIQRGRFQLVSRKWG